MFYINDRKDKKETSLLGEEQVLLELIAERLGNIIERFNAEDTVRAFRKQ